jgi:hypothetical protein
VETEEGGDNEGSEASIEDTKEDTEGNNEEGDTLGGLKPLRSDKLKEACSSACFWMAMRFSKSQYNNSGG